MPVDIFGGSLLDKSNDPMLGWDDSLIQECANVQILLFQIFVTSSNLFLKIFGANAEHPLETQTEVCRKSKRWAFVIAGMEIPFWWIARTGVVCQLSYVSC